MDEQTPAERQLTEHHHAGRLDDDDYRLRMARARLATSRAELDELFADLPGGYDDTPEDHQWPVLGGQPASAPTWKNPPAPASQPSPYAQPSSASGTSTYADAFPDADPNPSWADPAAGPYAAASAGTSWRQPPPAQSPDVPVVVPPSPTPARSGSKKNKELANLLVSIAWPACIVLMVLTKMWWLILVPIFVVPAVANYLKNKD